MMPVRWLTSRSRTRCSACRSSCSAVFVATNFIVGRCTASAIASALCRHQPGIVAKCLKLAAEMMCTNTSLHADQARRHVGQPCLDLATRPLLAQNDRATAI